MLTDQLFGNLWLAFLAVAWSLPWKGVALWRAAQNRDKRWFVVLLLVNTLAVLDILYIYIWGKRKAGQIKNQAVDNFT